MFVWDFRKNGKTYWLSLKNKGKRKMAQVLKNQIDFQWDEETGVWIATSKEIPGLILEHENKDILMKRAREAVPDLQALNEYVRNATPLDTVRSSSV